MSNIFHVNIRSLYLGILLWLVPCFSFAFNYSVSPPIIDLEVSGRDILSHDITLQNNGGSLIRIYPTVNEIAVADGGDIKRFEQAVTLDRADSVTSWIEISRGRIELTPTEEYVIPLTLRVPPNVEPGEYHALIGFASASNKNKATELVLAGQAPATVVRISIGQNTMPRLTLEQFVVDRFVTDSAKGEVSYTVANTGDAVALPTGEIIFYDTRGREVGTTPINSAGEEVAAGSNKIFTSLTPPDLRLGKYKAFLSLYYGDLNTASLTDTSFFYVMPILPMLLIFFSVLLLCIVIIVYMHRRLAHVSYEDEPQDVAFYRSSEPSVEAHHDIDLSKKK